MKHLAIFFVFIVQLMYVCESLMSGRLIPGPHGIMSETCPFLRYPANGYIVRCTEYEHKSKCTAQCLAHHYFEGTYNQRRMTLECRFNNLLPAWMPLPSFPNCVYDGQCNITLRENHAGFIKCQTGQDLIDCTVQCHGKDHGWFTCFSSGEWSRRLPTCVKEI